MRRRELSGERVGGHGTPRDETRHASGPVPTLRMAVGDHVGRREPQPIEARRRHPGRAVPVATANAMSPSKRVCAGRSARANPSCALCASRKHAALSSTASVTTTTSVVFARPSSNGSGVGKPGRVGRRGRARQRSCRRRAMTSPTRVDDRERADAHAVDRRSTATPTPPGTAPSRPRHLPDRRARARADPARRQRLVARRRDRGRVAVVGARRWTARLDEVEDARGGHDRHGPARGREPLPALGEVAHHAVGRGQPERGAAREHDRVDARDGARRIEQIGLPRRGRAAAHLAGTDRTRREQQHRDAGAARGSRGRRVLRRSRSSARRHRRRAGRAISSRVGARALRTSRAKSTISRSSSSVRSSISM